MSVCQERSGYFDFLLSLEVKLEAFLNSSLVINMFAQYKIFSELRSLHGKIGEFSSKAIKCGNRVERKEKRQSVATTDVLPSLKASNEELTSIIVVYKLLEGKKRDIDQFIFICFPCFKKKKKVSSILQRNNGS